jgi:glucose/arabinose dehydrogenase
MVTGSERLGWTQSAPSAGDLATFHYAVYLDGSRSELAGATCEPTQSETVYQCSAPLPAMSAGPHTIELAAFIVDGGVLESPRSAPIQLTKTALATAPAPGPASTWPERMALATTDGLQLNLARVATGVRNPVDLAFTPDGRLFVAEEDGQVRVLLPDGRLVAEPAVALAADTRLLALAVDQRFEQTGFVYVLGTTPSRDGGRAFTLFRFREAANAFFSPILLLDGVAAASRPTGAVRTDVDGSVFVALDDGGDAQQAGDFSAPNGKILRITSDGTTPADQAGLTPMYASDLRSPRGFAWQPRSQLLWIADQVTENSAVVAAIGPATGTGRRGAKLTSYALPRGTRPSSLAFYAADAVPALNGNLLIASNEGQHLLRVRFDDADPTRVVETERLLRNAIGGIRSITVSRDGKIYLATSDALATLELAAR